MTLPTSVTTMTSRVGAKLAERFSLEGRVAIVTGASRGIGAAIATALADAGATVVVASRKLEGCQAVQRAIEERGGRAHAQACHVGTPDDVARLVDDTAERFGRIDVLVNNAATNPAFGGLIDVDGAAFDKIYAVNVRGPLLLSQRVQPIMARQQRGSIVHIASVGGLSPEPLLGVYSSSKAALISLAKGMAKEWGGLGIRSNVIAPGLVKTKFAQAIWSDDALLSHAVGEQAIARAAEPEEVAGLALFLASDASSYCTGGVFLVDGGHML